MSTKEAKAFDFKLMGRLMPYVRRDWKLAAAAFSFMIAQAVLGALHPTLIQKGIDIYIPAKDLAGLWHISMILLLVLSTSSLSQVFFTWLAEFLGQKILYNLRMDLFRHLGNLQSSFFDRTPIGKSLTGLTNDVEAIRDFMSEGILTVSGDLLKIIVIIILMIHLNPKLAAVALITVPLYAGATLAFRRGIRGGFRLTRKANSEMNSTIVESLAGMRELTLFRHRKNMRSRFDVLNTEYVKAFLKVILSYSLYLPLVEVITNLGLLLMILYAHFQLGVTLTTGNLFAFFFYMNMFFRPLRQIAENFNTFQSAMAAAERVFNLLDEKPSLTQKADAVTSEIKNGEVSFENAEFAYGEEPVLKGVSFHLRPGEKLGLVGSTGSGKTTVINLLTRLYDVKQGAVKVDGIDVRDLTLKNLREGVAVIPQDVFLFTGSFFENIAIARPDASFAEVLTAAKAAHADTFIGETQDDFNKPVLEEGKSLSAGQKQLIAFARAFLKNAPVLILDEATANIDSNTEFFIQDAMENLLKSRTAILVAHRLSTIRNCDRILVMHHGKIAEEGTHEELNRKKGLYHRLYQMQMLSLKI